MNLLMDALTLSVRYVLDNPTPELAIEVFINGYFVPAGGTWHFDAFTNAVVFDYNLSSEGNSIMINYFVRAFCE